MEVFLPVQLHTNPSNNLLTSLPTGNIFPGGPLRRLRRVVTAGRVVPAVSRPEVRVMCFSRPILLRGAAAVALAVAETSGDQVAVTSTATGSGSSRPSLIACSLCNSWSAL